MADPTPFHQLAVHQLTVDTTHLTGKTSADHKQEDLKAVSNDAGMKKLMSDAKAWRTEHPESSYEVK